MLLVAIHILTTPLTLADKKVFGKGYKNGLVDYKSMRRMSRSSGREAGVVAPVAGAVAVPVAAELPHAFSQSSGWERPMPFSAKLMI